MINEVIIRLEIDGFHRYPNAPEEVSFLANNHRHTFVITCAYAIIDLDREKEIFICRDEVKKYIENKYGIPAQFNDMSCEMICNDILNSFSGDWMRWCEVWEENTGGARVVR